MHVELVDKPLEAIEADITIEFIVPSQFENHPKRPVLEKAGFTGKAGQSCTLHESGLHIVCVAQMDASAVRDAAAQATRTLGGFGYVSAKTTQYGSANTQALTEGLLLGAYRFDRYKSEIEKPSLATVFLSTQNADGTQNDAAHIEQAVTAGTVLAEATNFTRDLVNTTPDDMTPNDMAVLAESMAQTHGLACEIFDENALLEARMHALLAVARASRHKPRMIHLAYKPKNPKAVVSLVGKGLTYDSGGLSLKPATSMVTMKMDKAGACAVLGMLKAAAELKLDVEVHGFVGAVENMIGGDAYKPDDVLVARNGKTIEVRNTDAEGRLVLADVLCYAQDTVKADYLFDFATLTGACMVALGPYTAGVMGHSGKLKHTVHKAADRAGELVGSLPFNDLLGKLLKSDVADVSNIGSKPYGGAITAALFLDHFITDEMKERWIHFDIAGPAYTEAPWGVNPHGGTGAGVRTGIALMELLSKK